MVKWFNSSIVQKYLEPAKRLVPSSARLSLGEEPFELLNPLNQLA